MRWQIPAAYDLSNRTLDVRWMTPLERIELGADGYFDPVKGEVLLATGHNKDYTDHTFLHELVHGILHAMGRDDLNNDEGFVDAFAGLLHQFFKTKAGKISG